MKQSPIVMERILQAPASKVWYVLTTPAAMKEWYFDIPDFLPESGHQFSFTGTTPQNKSYLHLCEITEIIPLKKLAYTWCYNGYEGNSLVTFELFEEGPITRLRLTHAQLESFPADNPDLAGDNFVAGWNYLINTSLVNFLAQGKEIN